MFVVKEITVVLVISCMAFLNCGRESKEKEKTAKAIAMPSAKNEIMYHFDVRNRTHSQPMDRNRRAPEKIKFVEVEVADVVNPKKHPIAFSVHYLAADGSKIFLGSFALFPADNPGKFIVPTSGKLKSEGDLSLSLDLPESANDDDQLKISVKEMRLREE